MPLFSSPLATSYNSKSIYLSPSIPLVSSPYSSLSPFLVQAPLSSVIMPGEQETEREKMGRQPCCAKVGLKKGPWSPEEDKKLLDFLLNNPLCCWRLVPKLAGLLRCGKSCRLRWLNYLRPDLKRGLLSESEEKLVIDLHAQLGNRWSKIVAQLPGRTDNEIKNLWNTHIKKKLIKMGINPITHKPISPSKDRSVESHEEEEEEEKTPTVSLCSNSDKGLTSSSVSSSASSTNSAPMIKDEAIELPTIDWDEPMWLLEMDDIKGFEFLSTDLDSNLCF